MLQKDIRLQDIVKKFCDENCSHTEIFMAGCSYFTALFGAKKEEEAINIVRFDNFRKQASKAGKKVDLRSLCPTDEAIRQHSYRVHCQIQTWLGRTVDFQNWGWKVKENSQLPVTTIKQPAPAILLKSIFCSCKKGCGPSCGCIKLGKLEVK